ncbi:hypothetical protein QUA20_28435 [Microcoleus sp. Pol7_A1]|uniref:hypothetical protein n=1 Tax=Microcoleus sp. Pol7_A1 TaxID=2818893 RepID=UPI002FD30A61
MLIKIIGNGAIDMSGMRRAIAFWDGKVERTLCLFLNAEVIALFDLEGRAPRAENSQRIRKKAARVHSNKSGTKSRN